MVFLFLIVVVEFFGVKIEYLILVVELIGFGGGFCLFCGGIGFEYFDIINVFCWMMVLEYEFC